jgi:hypothetical protein
MAGFGLKIVKSQGPEGFTGNTAEYEIDPANTGSIFTGDPVLLDGNGWIVEATGGAANNDFNILGVFVGVRYVDSDGSYKYRQYWNGGSGRSQIKAMVALPPVGMFAIRGNAGTNYTRAGTAGKRFGMNYFAGSTQYGDSRSTLAAATAATGPLLVHGLADLPGNVYGTGAPTFVCSVARPQGFPQVVA